MLGVEATGGQRDVFNLSVGETATYFVGEPRALVHNTSPSGLGNCVPSNPIRRATDGLNPTPILDDELARLRDGLLNRSPDTMKKKNALQRGFEWERRCAALAMCLPSSLHPQPQMPPVTITSTPPPPPATAPPARPFGRYRSFDPTNVGDTTSTIERNAFRRGEAGTGGDFDDIDILRAPEIP